MIGRWRALRRSTTFRLALLAAAVFALSTALVLVYVYAATAGALARRTDRALAAEVAELSAAYRAKGINAGLNKEVTQRSVVADELLYLLGHESGRRITGNLTSFPESWSLDGETVRFVYARTEGERLIRRRAQGRLANYPGGYRLLVARDVEEDARVVDSIGNAALTASVFVLALGLASGAFLSGRFARRIEALNAVVQGVRAGDLSQRAPRNNSGDELDELSGHLNAMLDRIEKLMTAMRYAGDSIAHDLRTPLTRLRASLELAVLQAREEESGALRKALEDAEAILATFTAVLRIARLETGEKRDALVAMPLAPLIANLAELYGPACEDAALSFSAEIAEGVDILGDASLLNQAVANLLDNAIKYTPAGGAVALRLRRTSAGEIEVSVTDTGPGIPAPDRERVKQRFVRLENSRSTPGSGLGLSLVQAVADIHGARFALDDGPGLADGPGPGLRAALIFPEAR